MTTIFSGFKSVRSLLIKSHEGDVTLNRLKNFRTLNLRNVTTDQLRSAVESTLHGIEIMQVNEGYHMEHLFLNRLEHD